MRNTHRWPSGRSGVPKAAPERAQVETRGGPAPLSERNAPADVICAEAVRIAQDICQGVQWNRESARAAALQLVTLLTPSTATGPADARGGLAPWQKRKVDDYVREHIRREIRVKELASTISISASHFYRAFKATHGETPRAYVTRLRLELAQQLMLRTDEPLTQIALACGFADQSHLSKAFRRVLAETPSAWRRRNRDDARLDAKAR